MRISLRAAAAALTLITSCNPFCNEQFQPGVSIPAGSGYEVLAGERGLVYSMRGRERISDSELKQVSLFHAVVLLPAEDIRGSGSKYQSDCLYGEETLVWQRGHYQKGPFNLPDGNLKLTYEGSERTVSINGMSFDADRNNCFLIRIDKSWKANTTPLPILITEDLEPLQVLSTLRRLLPSNEVIRGASVHSEKTANPADGAPN